MSHTTDSRAAQGTLPEQAPVRGQTQHRPLQQRGEETLRQCA